MKLFLKLRGAIATAGFTQDEVGETLKLNRSAVSYRLSGKYKWNIEEVYAVCDLLGISCVEISTYFPKNGKDIKKGGQAI